MRQYFLFDKRMGNLSSINVDVANIPPGIYLSVLRDAKQQIMHTEKIVLSR
ncbi:MAG: hypothetical protein R2798_00895 [Chitinophagales bacterium]|nr:hypothetical protein [Bacteroidota bacterium]